MKKSKSGHPASMVWSLFRRLTYFTYFFTVCIACRASHCREKSSTCSPSLSLTVSTTWTRFGSRSRRCSGCSRSLSAFCRWYVATATTSTSRGSERSRRGTRTVRRGTCRNSPSRRRSFLQLVCIKINFVNAVLGPVSPTTVNFNRRFSPHFNLQLA